MHKSRFSPPLSPPPPGHTLGAQSPHDLDANNSNDWLAELLADVGLEQFFEKVKNDLQVTRPSHFEFVSEDDLIDIGMSRPAAKRLLATVKKQNSLMYALKTKIVNKLKPQQLSSSASCCSNSSSTSPQSSSLAASLSLASSGPVSRSTFHHLPPHFGNVNSSASGSKQSSNADNKVGRRTDEAVTGGSLRCLINNQDIELKEQIGHGVHGVVRKAVWTTPSGRTLEVAAKILKSDLKLLDQQNVNLSEFVREINVMHRLNHVNLIKLFGIVLSPPLMMVTELAPHGNLRDRLRKECGHTPISLLVNFSIQIAAGMEYLESNRLVHRDLAARNVFIGRMRCIKIGDFGLMRAIPQQEDHYTMNETTKIPFPWCAPESLKLKQFSHASDSFMFAVTLWEMFTFGQQEPWAGMSAHEIVSALDRGKRLPCPHSCPSNIYSTLLQCWQSVPSQRPTFSSLGHYLSTSYPLEVKVKCPFGEESATGTDCSAFVVPLNVESSSQQSRLDDQGQPENSKSKRKLMQGQCGDRILAIEGEPQHYWWKGQNQRTFEIGWFPLPMTQWLEPSKHKSRKMFLISKPIKNSFIHTGHGGPDGTWGNPSQIDPMYLNNPLCPGGARHHMVINGSRQRPHNHHESSVRIAVPNVNSSGQVPFKTKTRARLCRLFGINGDTNAMSSGSSTTSSALLVDGAYRRFMDESGADKSSTPTRSKNDIKNQRSSQASKRAAMQRSQSQDAPFGANKSSGPRLSSDRHRHSHQKTDGGAPLIDFSDEIHVPLQRVPGGPHAVSDLPDLIDSSLQISNRTGQGDRYRPDDGDVVHIQWNGEMSNDNDNSHDSNAEDAEKDSARFLRHHSDTNLHQVGRYYAPAPSFTGSWNTNTFEDDGTNQNNYSRYYCPQDAMDGSSSSCHYYSAVPTNMPPAVTHNTSLPESISNAGPNSTQVTKVDPPSIHEPEPTIFPVTFDQ